MALYLLFGFVWNVAPVGRKLTAGFMLVYILHEWEECRFPGGFHSLFFGRIGVEPKAAVETMHIPVAIALLVILILPWVFPSVTALVLVPVCLSLFEGFVHTFGIILMKMKKPYTPGMATAWLAFAFAVYSIRLLNADTGLSAGTWVAGIILFLIAFIGMQRWFIGIAGYSYRELIPLVKKNLLGR